MLSAFIFQNNLPNLNLGRCGRARAIGTCGPCLSTTREERETIERGAAPGSWEMIERELTSLQILTHLYTHNIGLVWASCHFYWDRSLKRSASKNGLHFWRWTPLVCGLEATSAALLCCSPCPRCSSMLARPLVPLLRVREAAGAAPPLNHRDCCHSSMHLLRSHQKWVALASPIWRDRVNHIWAKYSLLRITLTQYSVNQTLKKMGPTRSNLLTKHMLIVQLIFLVIYFYGQSRRRD
jgi:hypothetical protein